MLMGLGAVPLQAGAFQASLQSGLSPAVSTDQGKSGLPRWLLPVGIGAAALVGVVIIIRRRNAAAHNPRRRRRPRHVARRRARRGRR